MESTGTQWIDTGVTRIITNKYKFIGNISYSDITNRQLNGAQGYVYFGVISGYYQITNGSYDHTDVTVTLNTFTPFEVEFDCPNNIVSYNIDGVYKTNKAVYKDVPANAHFALFSLNNGILPGKEKISYFQIYDNDILVRDFIPVLDGNGTPCMYDKVEGKFYYNAGTGDFIAGPVIGSGE